MGIEFIVNTLYMRATTYMFMCKSVNILKIAKECKVYILYGCGWVCWRGQGKKVSKSEG